jgi:hypothetical protein
MKKLAIFVEGQTERMFVEKLIRLMVDHKQLRIVVFRAIGGKKTPRRIELVHQMPPGPDQAYYIEIVESRNDDRVASDVRDNYDKLVFSNFCSVIAIRDVYPVHAPDKIPELRKMLRYRLKTKPIDPRFVLGVMEIEAWFLAEYTHFARIHINLTLERIKTDLGFDPSVDDMQTRPCPHDDLHRIYQLEGLSYQKKASQLQRTINHLDYGNIYLQLINKFPDLHTLVQALDGFFT